MSVGCQLRVRPVPVAAVGGAQGDDVADEVGELAVEADVLAAAEDDQVVAEARGWCGPRPRRSRRTSCRQVWAARMKDSPRARSLAIRVRSVGMRRGGGQLVEAGQERWAEPAVRGGLAEPLGGVEDVLGDGGHQR